MSIRDRKHSSDNGKMLLFTLHNHNHPQRELHTRLAKRVMLPKEYLSRKDKGETGIEYTPIL